MTRLACVLSQTLPRSCAIHQVEASIGNLRRLTASDWFALRSEASPSTDLGTQSWCIAPKYISGIAMVSSQRTKYIFSLKVGHFNESILHTQRISTDDLWKIAKNINVKTYGILIFNMICGLSMTHSHPTKITKWTHILVIPLVGPLKPRTKGKNSPTHPGTEKRKAKVLILGDFRGGVRVLFHRFQTWACGYEEI